MMHFVAPLLMILPEVYIKIGVILPRLQVLHGQFFVFSVVLIIDYKYIYFHANLMKITKIKTPPQRSCRGVNSKQLFSLPQAWKFVV